MGCDVVLDHGKRLVLHRLSLLRQNFSDVGQMIRADILVPYILEDFSGELSKFVTLCMNEMTEVTSRTPSWTMEIPAWHGSVVASFDKLIRVWWGICCDLCGLDFVGLLKFTNCLIG